MRTFQLKLRRAEKHLQAADPAMAKLIAAHGKCGLVPFWDRSPYESLVRAVAHQQLHGRAAEAILGRLVARFPGQSFPEPDQLVQANGDALRALGFSQAKVATIQGIAGGVQSGIVPSRAAAEELTDAALIEQISSLRGIGQWTVEMLLIFTLGRLDVMPMGDFGIRAGLQKVYRLKAKATKHDFARRTDRWAPYRSIGAWYLWREADRLKQAAQQVKRK